ncbi:MAG: Flp pilus assembly protein CpaB [Thermoguttaceae bacterium]|nr:Flp pilus assembly protein CpaB [Thermoguttaceae bacterium]
MTIGIVAVLAGLAGAYGIRSMLQQPTPEEPKKPVVKKVPMANTDLPAGRVIAAGDISLIEISGAELQNRGLDLNQVLVNPKDIVGRRLRVPVKQGEPILTTALYLAGTGPNVSERLKPGFRAVTLAVPEAHGGDAAVGGFVDVVFRTEPRPGGEGIAPIPEMTVTLLSHVEVLEVEKAPLGGAGRDIQVTLALPIDQVNMIKAVEGRGEFSLVPRPEGEIGVAKSEKRETLETALGIPLPEPPEPPEPPFRTAVYRRGSLQVNTFVSGMLVDDSGRVVSSRGAAGTSQKGCKNCKGKGQAVPVDPRALKPEPDAATRTPTLAPPKPVNGKKSPPPVVAPGTLRPQR